MARPLAVGALIEAATQITNFTREDITGRVRNRKFVYTRNAIALIARRASNGEMSYPLIGERLGGRDHSTILHGIAQAKAAIETDQDFAAFVIKLEARARQIGTIWMIEKKPRANAKSIKKPAAKPAKIEVIQDKHPVPYPAHKVKKVQGNKASDELNRTGNGNPFWLDEDGEGADDRMLNNMVIIGSWKLACAIINARAA